MSMVVGNYFENIKKLTVISLSAHNMAERIGFEPAWDCPLAVSSSKHGY